MALVDLPQGYFFYPMPITEVVSTSILTVNASNEYVAVVFRVPKTGTISEGGITLDTIAGAQTLRMSLQDVDLTTGLPDGTQDEYRDLAGGSLSADAYNHFGILSDDGTDVGVQRSVTKGDYLALKVEFESTIGDVDFETRNNEDIPLIHMNFPYSVLNGVKQNDHNICPYLEYSDGSALFIPGHYPFEPSKDANRIFSASTNPDQRGLRFQLPFPATCWGLWFVCEHDADADYYLHEAATSPTQRATVNHDGNVIAQGLAHRVVVDYFDASYDLAANTEYIVSVHNNGSGNIEIDEFGVDTNARFDAFPGGKEFYLATRNNVTGNFTTDTTVRPHMGLVLSAVDDGAGGGGGGGGRLVGGSLAWS